MKLANWKQHSPVKKGSFLWPHAMVAHAATQDEVPMHVATSSPHFVKMCSKMTICLEIPAPAFIQTDTKNAFEIWQSASSTTGTMTQWSVVTFFKNPDIHLDFTKVEHQKLTILGKERDVQEHKKNQNGKKIFVLYGSLTLSSGEEVLVQVMSNTSILTNSSLKKMLVGYEAVPAPVAKDIPKARPKAPSHPIDQATLLIAIAGVLCFLAMVAIGVVLVKRNKV